MKFTYEHNNINVLDLEKSLKFYAKALNMHEDSRIVPEDGAFIIVYLKPEIGNNLVELTWLRDKTEPYNLGDNEFHMAFRVDDLDNAKKLHQDMDVIVFENPEMGIYFIADPDGYWIEICPPK